MGEVLMRKKRFSVSGSYFFYFFLTKTTSFWENYSNRKRKSNH
jgi:hypothetical protein